ncbi:hypothetical protein CU102_06820 [Phyllobacterium brassicacearum]|uniref:Secreted protein n=1 Tax=Phyllobacterium brassicacearum TaxID=314235 RepID=A0A2P7BU02_9HYPH|nr:hypothetical protein CU102_06820 [Phyllobacterium brassicacearum]
MLSVSSAFIGAAGAAGASVLAGSAGAGAGAGAAGAGCSVVAGACSDFFSPSPQAASVKSETAASETKSLFLMVFLSEIYMWPLGLHITQNRIALGFVFVLG